MAGTANSTITARKSRSRAVVDLANPLPGHYGIGGSRLRDGPRYAPRASVNYGAAGIAYALFRLARARERAGLVELADAWGRRALELASLPDAFESPGMGLLVADVGVVSLFHSVTGVHCVRALIGALRGDAGTIESAVDAFISYSRGPCDSPDLTLGTASLLLGCAELLESLDSRWQAERTAVRARGDEIAAALTDFLRGDDIATSEAMRFQGISHGWAGLLFALLRWSAATRQVADPLLARKLDDLADRAVAVQDGVIWTIENNGNSIMPGWCHGPAGYTMLYTLAYEVLQYERYAQTAIAAANATWLIPNSIGQLCCGNGGNAYAFLAAYRLTRSGNWLRRARIGLRRAAADRSEPELDEALYKGALGISLLAAELERPSLASMPLFEPLAGF